MAKHRNAVSCFCRVQNVASACNAGGSSSLHTRMNAAARLMQPLRCAATHFKTSHRFLHHARVKHTAHASTGTTSAAHSTARAPLQQHLHFLHATPRHTLHDPRSPAPRRPVHHVHTGRRGGQSKRRRIGRGLFDCPPCNILKYSSPTFGYIYLQPPLPSNRFCCKLRIEVLR